MEPINLRRHFVGRVYFLQAIFIVRRINIQRCYRDTRTTPEDRCRRRSQETIRGGLVRLLANGCVASLLIAPVADLIQPRNRCPGQVLTGDVDNCGAARLIWTIRHRER